MAQKKCVICGENISSDEETVPFKSRTAHLKCFNVHIKAIGEGKKERLKEVSKERKQTKKKPKVEKEIKGPVTEQEHQYKQDYYEYLRKLIGEEDIPTKIYAITEKIKDQYDYTFVGMKQTLVYLNEIMGKELVGDIVGIIPFYYEEANKYYDDLIKIEEANKDIDSSGFYKERVIVIKPRRRVPKQLPFD